MVNDEKQNELLFYIALAYFMTNNYKKARKYINEIVLVKKANSLSLIFRATRILSIIMRYEDKEFDYLNYEIRSYKRSFKGTHKPLQTELLIFKLIKQHPDFNAANRNQQLWRTIHPVIEAIQKDKFELQLLKYFDATE